MNSKLNTDSDSSSKQFRMLKSTLGHVKRHLYGTSLKNRLVIFTGDDLWYSVRGGALNSKGGGFGGDSILRERIDFWENTSYGHGGDAKGNGYQINFMKMLKIILVTFERFGLV